jgi:hypothetical protein
LWPLGHGLLKREAELLISDIQKSMAAKTQHATRLAIEVMGATTALRACRFSRRGERVVSRVNRNDGADRRAKTLM